MSWSARLAGGPPARPRGASGRGGRQPDRLRRLAHRRRGAVEHLRRPQGRRLPPVARTAAGGAAGPLGDQARLDGGLLRLRAGAGLLADEAVRAPRRAHPGLLTRRVAGRGPSLEQLDATQPAADRATASASRTRGCGPTGPRCATPSASRARRCSTSAPRPEYARRAVLALRRHGTGRPRRTRPDRGPPAHRRPLRRARGVPARAGAAQRLLVDRPRRRPAS